MDQAYERNKRNRWSHEETIGFLKCYLPRRDEFEHVKKKRKAYANVLEDMIAKGLTDSKRTPLCLESKMRTLLHGYKTARENNRTSGATSSFAPYMELMDKIFGGCPMVSTDHTVHVGYRSFEMVMVPSPQASPADSRPPSPFTVTKIEAPSPPTLSASNMEDSMPSPSPPPSSPLLTVLSASHSAHTPAVPRKHSRIEVSSSPPLLISKIEGSLPPSSPLMTGLAPSSSAYAQAVSRKRTAREIYYEEKLKIRKLEAEEKKKARSEALQEFKDLLTEKWERDFELERRKVELLEKLALFIS
ncbi:cyclic AMP-responsive element-binding protein 3-like protein 1 [Anastrepha ludens]|uniref:cyclic AMP-responsive element-binding protein 3-like protein 1 n=1 Tax=Anastrepha ludens TaxID=28586 RepID=UPI0023B1BD12|nr:cyclic AMP-responsive element-binding protein 3-like protein 1 [Anastrepha ludens]